MAHRLGILAIGSLAALTVLAAPVVWQIADSQASARHETDVLLPLHTELQTLREELGALRARVDGLDARTSLGIGGVPQTVQPRAPARQLEPAPPLADRLRDDFAQVVLIADRRSTNDGLSVASAAFLRDTFGLPRADLSDDCQNLTNPALLNRISTENVGPIRARLLGPALASLRRVFAEVQAFEPALYNRIASSGSLCVRLIRGASAAASAHAYGLAVDLNIDGQLDTFADGRTQLGLVLLADFFKREGWIWGAGFTREDSMHFEVSREKIEEWRSLDLL
jgi:hypothetical protein